MDDTDQQKNNPEQTQNLSSRRERVLQPSSSSLAEINAAQQEQAEAAAAKAPEPTQTGSTVQTPSPTRPAFQPNSVYPEATKGLGVPPPPINQNPITPSTEHSPVDIQIASKILLVRLVAGAMLLINAVNAYDWFIERRGGYTNWVGIIEIAILFLLAAYIFRLSETARATYVFIASLLIVLTCATSILFYVRNHDKPVITESGISSPTKSELNQGIVNVEHNTRLTATQKRQIINGLHNQLSLESGRAVDIKAKQYLSDALLIITAVGPIIFFTRPSIRAVFQ